MPRLADGSIVPTITKRYPAPAWARKAGDGAATPITPAAARELIRGYGSQLGWGGWNGPTGFASWLTGETPEIRRHYTEMAFREGSIKAPLLDRIYAVAQQDWTVAPATKADGRDAAIAEAFKFALENCKGGLPQIVWEVGFPAALEGRVLCEIVLNDELEVDGDYVNKRMLRAVKARHPSTHQIKTDDYGNLVAVKATNGGREYAGDDLKRFIYYVPYSLYGDLNGISELRAAYRAFTNKDAAWKLRRFFVDKLAGGFLVAKGVTSQVREAMKAALAEARSCGFLTLEPGQEIEILNLALGAEDAFKKFIDDCDREMMVAVNGSHLPHQEGQTPNVAGNSRVQQDTAASRAWKLSADVAWFVNGQVADVWVTENFMSARRPKFVWGGVDPKVQSAAVADVAALAAAGYRPKPEQVHERTGWEVAAAAVPGMAPGQTAPGAFADDYELVPAELGT